MLRIVDAMCGTSVPVVSAPSVLLTVVTSKAWSGEGPLQPSGFCGASPASRLFVRPRPRVAHHESSRQRNRYISDLSCNVCLSLSVHSFKWSHPLTASLL